MDTYAAVLLIFCLSVIDEIICELVSPGGVSCNEECQVAPHIRCTVIQDAICQSDSYSSDNVGWPSEPENLDVSVTPGTAPLVNVFWNIPNDSSFSIVTGFLLKITSLSINEMKCVHIDLAGTLWKTSDLTQNLMFQFTCLQGLTPEGFYYLKLQSLPLSDPEYKKMKDMYVAFNQVDAGSISWLSVMKFQVKVSHNKFSALHVLFKPAPSEFGFTGYDIAVMGQNDNIIQSKSVHVAWKNEVAYQEVWFENICKGQYQLVLTPHNQSMYNGSCTCGGVSPKCKNCAHASTSLFFANTDKQCKTLPMTFFTSTETSAIKGPVRFRDVTTTSNKNTDSTTLVVITILVAGCIMIALVTILGFFIYKQVIMKSKKKDTDVYYKQSEYNGKSEIWTDFNKNMESPDNSANFEGYTLNDIKMMNDKGSQRVHYDPGFADTASLPDEYGDV